MTSSATPSSTSASWSCSPSTPTPTAARAERCGPYILPAGHWHAMPLSVHASSCRKGRMHERMAESRLQVAHHKW